eukprot:maker-scaffold_8-augustus-gene-13.62-mRNA-1 protein AED:0.00 eAED:0.00 QI:54/1/1/1/1/1/2/219/127
MLRQNGNKKELFSNSRNRQSYTSVSNNDMDSPSFHTEKQLLQSQDKHLENLESLVDQFGDQTKGMKAEIDAHMTLIDELDTEVQKSNTIIDTVNSKAVTLIEKSGGEIRVILILTLISFILLILLLN